MFDAKDTVEDKPGARATAGARDASHADDRAGLGPEPGLTAPAAQHSEVPTPSSEPAPRTRPQSPPRPLSERVRLARMSLRAALLLPGVVNGDSGPLGLHTTGAGDGQRLDGVSAAAVGEDGYALSLRLIVRPVDLPTLGARVREAVAVMAESEGLGASLRSVDVLFSDLDTGREGR